LIFVVSEAKFLRCEKRKNKFSFVVLIDDKNISIDGNHDSNSDDKDISLDLSMNNLAKNSIKPHATLHSAGLSVPYLSIQST
jgi:hypothetical protein